MTNYEVRPVTELRDEMHARYLEQLDHAGEAALAVPSEPRWNYRLRLAATVFGACPDLTERQIHGAWRHDPRLSQKIRAIHNVMCDIRLGKLAGTIEQLMQDEARNGHVILD
jgi:hypothetical protein